MGTRHLLVDVQGRLERLPRPHPVPRHEVDRPDVHEDHGVGRVEPPGRGRRSRAPRPAAPAAACAIPSAVSTSMSGLAFFTYGPRNATASAEASRLGQVGAVERDRLAVERLQVHRLLGGLDGEVQPAPHALQVGELQVGEEHRGPAADVLLADRDGAVVVARAVAGDHVADAAVDLDQALGVVLDRVALLLHRARRRRRSRGRAGAPGWPAPPGPAPPRPRRPCSCARARARRRSMSAGREPARLCCSAGSCRRS